MEGHNRRSCDTNGNPNEKPEVVSGIASPISEARNNALILRVDGLTVDEVDRLHSGIVKLKRAEINDLATAVLITGKSSELPNKVRGLLKDLEDEIKTLQSRSPTEGN